MARHGLVAPWHAILHVVLLFVHGGFESVEELAAGIELLSGRRPRNLLSQIEQVLHDVGTHRLRLVSKLRTHLLRCIAFVPRIAIAELSVKYFCLSLFSQLLYSEIDAPPTVRVPLIQICYEPLARMEGFVASCQFVSANISKIKHLLRFATSIVDSIAAF